MAGAAIAGRPRWRDRLNAADRAVLRLAVGVTGAMILGMVLNWPVPFLAAVLTMKLVAAAPVAPRFGQGLVPMLIVFLASGAAFVMDTFLHDSPGAMFTVCGLVFFATFYAQRRGAPAVVMLLIQLCFCMVTLFSSVSAAAAKEITEALQEGILAAGLLTWVVHALIPAPPGPLPPPPPEPMRLPPREAVVVAITDVAVLLPLLIIFVLGQDTGNTAILVTILVLLPHLDPVYGWATAIGRWVGNVAGGALGLIVQIFVLTADTLWHFLAFVFVAGLFFGRRMVMGGPAAPTWSMAFSCFLIVVGIAVTPLTSDTENYYGLRVLRIAFAGLYALGVIALLSPFRRLPAVSQKNGHPAGSGMAEV